MGWKRRTLPSLTSGAASLVAMWKCLWTQTPRKRGRQTIGRASWMPRARTTAPTIDKRKLVDPIWASLAWHRHGRAPAVCVHVDVSDFFPDGRGMVDLARV